MKRKTNLYSLAVATFAVFTLGTGSVLAQATATFTTNANLGTNNDTWTAGANWDTGYMPGDTILGNPGDSAVIQTGLTALANSTAVVPYSGGLTIGENATLQIGSGGSTENRTQSANAIGTGSITMEAGSKIQWQMKVSPTIPELTLNGNASIVAASNESHARNFNFSEIIGSGQLTFLGVNNQTHTFDTASPSWSGGLVTGINSNSRTRFVGAAEGTFGTGNVTIGNLTDLQINNNNAGAGNTIGDAATLALEGKGRDQSPTTKVIMNGSETVNLLTIDGFPFPAGTYVRVGLGGVDTELALLSGNSILTVASEPVDNTPPTATFAGVGAGGSTTDVYPTEPVTFTVTFDEPLATTPTTSDFVNSTATGMTVESVTDVSPALVPNLVFSVVVKATEPGTLNLQIKSDAVLEDLFGNALVVPVADNDTFTVNALPAIEGQLGVWKPWANGGINPETGLAWAVGDNYHLAFVTSGTRDATSPDNADYDAFVQTAAGAVGWGATTWYAVVACYNDAENPNYNAARDANVPPMTTSHGIFLPNGAKLADDGSDLSNGPDVFFNITETLGEWNGNVGTGAGRLCGDPLQPKIEHGSSTRTDAAWWRVFNGNQTSQWHFYAVSATLTLQATGAGTPYENWAGGELFGDDANGDGVNNGTAFLLGALDPNVSALGLLPAVTETGGGLVMTFSMLNSGSRGTAALNVEHSSDLGITDPWTTVLVPDANGGPTSGVTFTVTPNGSLNDVVATISSSEAAAGKLFGRLKATD